MNIPRVISSLVIVLLAVMATQVSAQPLPGYLLYIQHPIVSGSTYQFDIYVQRTGTTPFRLGNSQFILSFNTIEFLNPAISRVLSSEETGSGFFFDQKITGNEMHISIGGNHLYSGALDIAATSPGTRIGTYRISGVNVPRLTPGLLWVNPPARIATGVSEIDAANNYLDITDGTGNSHVNGGGELGMIAGYAFNDLNGNGAWDQPIEPGLNGWQIVLTGPSGPTVQTSGSGSWPVGYFEFLNLPSAQYTLTEVLQAGWSQTLIPPTPIDLEPGESSLANNYGNYNGPAVIGTKFHDLDGNGLRDPGELGLPGWNINATKIGGGGAKNVTTDSLGRYVLSFQPAESGLWEIGETQQAGWVRTMPGGSGTYAINIQSGTYEAGKDFGNRFLAGLIGGTVFNDLNSDSTKNGSEPGLSGWEVVLSRNGIPMDTLTTDPSGVFEFANLPVGLFTVRELTRPGWQQTKPAPPGVYTITIVPSNAVFHALDFGNYKPGLISGFSYFDGNRNGSPDSGEYGLQGVEIRAVGISHSFHAFSASDGIWSLNNLPSDVYTLSEAVPEGFRLTEPAGGIYVVDVISGFEQTGLRFGHSASADTLKFRTFRYDSLAMPFDNRGRFGKSVKRKPDRVEFGSVFVNDLPKTEGLHLEYNVPVVVNDTSMPFRIIPPPSLVYIDGKRKKFDIFWADSIDNGDTVSIFGWSMVARPQKGKYGWMLPGAERTHQRYLRSATFTLNILRYPLPNSSNAIDEVYVLRGFSPPEIGMILGIRRIDAPGTYGWAQIRRPGDLRKSLYDRTGLHSGPPRGFMAFNNGARFVGTQKRVPPAKHNNRLFAEIATLKFNIEASRLQVLPAGLGGLIYIDGPNPLSGQSLSSLTLRADSMLTYYDGYLEEYFVNMDTSLRKINNAFSGAIDTISFAHGLKFKGVRPLADIGFLYADTNSSAILIPAPTARYEAVPSEYALYQNYPNPFNPATTIGFDLPTRGIVTLKIYNVLGQQVDIVLDNAIMEDGYQEVLFDARMLASGVYFYHLAVKSLDEDDDIEDGRQFERVGKMLLMR